MLDGTGPGEADLCWPVRLARAPEFSGILLERFLRE
jgi:hypothetical protein